MRYLLVLSIVVLALLAPQSARAGGVSLRWDNCYSDGGVINKTFACDTNAGSERLVMSFVLDSPLVNMSGVEARLAVVPASSTLPSWWQFKNTGTCRQSSLSLTLTPPAGSVNCTDWANGNATGGIGSYAASSEPAPNGMLVKLAAAVPPTALVTLAAGQEYVTGSLVIDHAKTTGTGACAGCDQPVCIVLDNLNLTTPTLANNRFLIDPAFGAGGNFARWQNAQEANVQTEGCGTGVPCYHTFSCELSSTPVRNSTWGAVKSLYR